MLTQEHFVEISCIGSRPGRKLISAASLRTEILSRRNTCNGRYLRDPERGCLS